MSYDPGLKKGWHYSHRHSLTMSKPHTLWGKLMAKFHRKTIVIAHHGGFKIVTIPKTSVHSHELAVCPPGFNPGDEDLLSISKGGKIIFDLAAFNLRRQERSKAQSKVDDWNSKSPIERFKMKIKGEK